MQPLRVLLVPDSIYWVTGTIAKAIATANPWIDATIVSGPLLGNLFDADEISRRFDLVHFICPYASREWLPLLREKTPVVTSHHHVTSWDLLKHNVEGDAIVAGSAQWVADLKSRGADMSRAFRVPYGVDTDLFKGAARGARQAAREKRGLAGASPVIGFFAKRASNDDDRKGTNIFVDAVMRVHRKIPAAGVLIVGPGWQDLVARFREAGIACTWIPFVVNTRDIAPLYHALDFYWVTARVEGGPVPLLEAMSSEICCLSTPVGLAIEVIKDGSNGSLLPMNDAAAFANRTVELWGDEQKRLALGKAARQTMLAEMNDLEMAKLVRPVYERAIEVFKQRNPAAKVAQSSGSAGLSERERKLAQMLEALAWSENLVLYQNQKGAALKLMVRAWLDNPTSLDPPRVMLRRLLPEAITRGIVRLKRKVVAAA